MVCCRIGLLTGLATRPVGLRNFCCVVLRADFRGAIIRLDKVGFEALAGSDMRELCLEDTSCLFAEGEAVRPPLRVIDRLSFSFDCPVPAIECRMRRGDLRTPFSASMLQVDGLLFLSKGSCGRMMRAGGRRDWIGWEHRS